MTITVSPSPTSGSFIDFLFGLIKPEEAFIPRVYTDSVGVPTLGVGYALITKQRLTGDGAQLDLKTLAYNKRTGTEPCHVAHALS